MSGYFGLLPRLIVAMGTLFTEMPVENCTPTGTAEPPIGASYRREFMKRFPGKLKA